MGRKPKHKAKNAGKFVKPGIKPTSTTKTQAPAIPDPHLKREAQKEAAAKEKKKKEAEKIAREDAVAKKKKEEETAKEWVTDLAKLDTKERRVEAAANEYWLLQQSSPGTKLQHGTLQGLCDKYSIDEKIFIDSKAVSR